jgi:hypothetical protein
MSWPLLPLANFWALLVTDNKPPLKGTSLGGPYASLSVGIHSPTSCKSHLSTARGEPLTSRLLFNPYQCKSMLDLCFRLNANVINPSHTSCLGRDNSRNTTVCRTFIHPVTGRRIRARLHAFDYQLLCIFQCMSRIVSKKWNKSFGVLGLLWLTTSNTFCDWYEPPPKGTPLAYFKVSAWYVLSLNSFQVPSSLLRENPTHHPLL